MFKNRDSSHMDNSVEYFIGPIYSFIGLVNSSSPVNEVWTGTNEAGFSIMNTASYNLKDDDVPSSEMDKEGIIMFRALGVCATVSDFENLLSSMSKPLGAESNFGVIDAEGGAAWFEVSNDSWKKYDVNEIPCGYRVVTNFSESGRREDYKGYERYLTASAVMEDFYEKAEDGKMDIGPHDLFYGMSRSYRHEVSGIDYLNDFNSLKKNFGFSGIVPDQDFIPRKSTCASVVIEGVRKGENPLNTVMWTILGYPCCSVTIPLIVGDGDMIPSYMKKSGESAWMCDLSLRIKGEKVFVQNLSQGASYIDLNSVMDLLHCCLATESFIESSWKENYASWISGNISFDTFKERYETFSSALFDRYLDHFSSFLQ